MPTPQMTDEEILKAFAGLDDHEAEALIDDLIDEANRGPDALPEEEIGDYIDQLIAILERYRSLIKLQEIRNGEYLQIGDIRE